MNSLRALALSLTAALLLAAAPAAHAQTLHVTWQNVAHGTTIGSGDASSGPGPISGGHSGFGTATTTSANYGQLNAYAYGRHLVSNFSGTHGETANAFGEWFDLVTVNLTGAATGKVHALYRITGLQTFTHSFGTVSNPGAGYQSYVEVGGNSRTHAGGIGQFGGTTGSGPLNGSPEVFALEENITSGVAFDIRGKVQAAVSNPLAQDANATGESTVGLEWLGLVVTDGEGNTLEFNTTSLSGKNWSNSSPAGASAVPEPSSALLLVAAGLPLALRRRRKPGAVEKDSEVIDGA